MPSLDAEACAWLQRRLIERTLHTAFKAALCPVELWCAPDCTHPFFAESAGKLKVKLRTQRGSDLGQRMHHALATILGYADFALIIGCDCPALDSSYLARASQTLIEGFPVVLGPAEDGGYVLVGARCTAQELFENIEWGTSRVLAQTRERLRTLDWPWHELETLWDIDRPSDLCRLAINDLA